MDTMYIYLSIGTLLILGLGFVLGKYVSQLSSNVHEKLYEEREHQLKQQLEELKQQFQRDKEEWNFKNREWEEDKSSMLTQLSQVKTEKDHLIQRLEEQKSEMELLNQKFQKEFENLANKILEEKTQKFSDTHKKELGSILDPFKESMKIFKEKVEKADQTNVEKMASLKQQIENLAQMNDKISKEAENLTKALKGDSKMQGNWGELILEKLLETSGLEKNREYFLEDAHITQGGQRVRLDARIILPDEKNIIIDSKMSLNAYQEYYNEDNPELKKQHIRNHLLSIRNHIKNLSQKNYPDIPVNTLDFTILFVPIESAYIVAVQEDINVFNDALKQNIVLAAPSTLLAMLKTIQNVWRREHQNQNVIEIARRAGDLYDKFNSLLEEFDKSERQMLTLQNTYQGIKTKLMGKGNLVRQVEKIKSLGAETNKQIDSKWLGGDEE